MALLVPILPRTGRFCVRKTCPVILCQAKEREPSRTSGPLIFPKLGDLPASMRRSVLGLARRGVGVAATRVGPERIDLPAKLVLLLLLDPGDHHQRVRGAQGFRPSLSPVDRLGARRID